MNELIFSIVLMVTPLTPPPADYKASHSISHVIAPTFMTSLDCQRMAKAFNNERGSHFKGHDSGPYKDVDGVIVGAWCTVHRIVKEKQ